MEESWSWGIIPLSKEEYNELVRKAEKLEAVREFVLSRRSDIEKDIEDFGMLKPVLNYFLEKEKDR